MLRCYPLIHHVLDESKSSGNCIMGDANVLNKVLGGHQSAFSRLEVRYNRYRWDVCLFPYDWRPANVFCKCICRQQLPNP